MARPKAELFVTHARIWSDGAIVPGAEALVVDGGRIVAVGPAAELESLADRSAMRLDACGATVTPALCDAHVHLLRWAHAADVLDLRDCTSLAGALGRVRARADERPRDAVLLGRGWDALGWEAPPDRRSLDGVCADRPVMLWAHDDHSLWVNSCALREAGIDRTTSDPEGGRLERDAHGEPTGIVREHAVRRFADLDARVPRAEDEDVLGRAAGRLHAMGVTAVHDFENAKALRVLGRVARTLGPRVRVLAHLTHGGLDEALDVGITSGTGDDMFRIGGVKLFADGTLGSRTAAMLAPFDGTSEVGMDLIPPEELRRLVQRAADGGISAAIHAIGDRACRSALDAFEACGVPRGGHVLPPRIEHAQLVDPADRPRFAALGVAASMQPSHCTSDIELAERFWHTRRESAYPWRSLLGDGALLAFGSDAPIEPPDPSLGLHAALTRRRPAGWPEGGYTPEQCVTLDQALSAYTEGPARLSGAWPRLGRIAPGAWADFVIWDRDLHREAPERLHAARPVVTAMAGEVVYAAHTGGTGLPAGARETAEAGR